MPSAILIDRQRRQMWAVEVTIRDLWTGEHLAVSVLGTDTPPVPVSDEARAEIQQICADAHRLLQDVLMRAHT